MRFKKLLSEDDGVSPVIGVILMVAITVILAAVIATFVLGLGEQINDNSPQANFQFDYTETNSDGYLNITHTGGETIKAQDLYINGDGDFSTGSWNNINDNDNSFGASSDIDAGATLDLESVSPEDTVRVVWRTSDGSQSATLQIWEGPNA